MIYLRLRSKQPLCVGSDHAQGFIRRTLPYIPGSTIRGALAAQLRSKYPNLSNAEFGKYILNPNVTFQNLYPLPEGFSHARPLPITAYSCKHHSGFIKDRAGRGPKNHGVRDTLFDNLRFIIERSQGQTPNMIKTQCQCGLPLEPFDGFYTGSGSSDYRLVKQSRRRITQTAIDPNRETARPANLFTVEALDEEQLFAGYISLENAADEQFFENICQSDEALRVGYGRTRGMGLMSVLDFTIRKSAIWVEPLAERLQSFNVSTDNLGTKGTLFSLTCLSDVIQLDPFFRHQPRIDGAALAREVDSRLGEAKLVAAFAQTRAISGWSTPHGLPLPTDVAIRIGSTFVYESKMSLADLEPLLQLVEESGIGERTNEGFGQVVACHPFHQEVSQI